MMLMKNLFQKKLPPLKCVNPDGTHNGDYRSLDPNRFRKVHSYILKKFNAHHHKNILIKKDDFKRLAIIVPYRYREHHLKIFAPHMKNYFASPAIQADICIIHQNDQKPFNRAKLCNVGFDLTKETHDYFCFHDIDMLSLDSCYEYPNHPTLLIHDDYPEGYFGGIVLFSKKDFQQVNGFSNEYWHWGWEDVDLRDRCYITGLTPVILKHSKYHVIHHPHSYMQTPDGVFHEDKKTLKKLKDKKRENRSRYLKLAHGKLDYLKDGLSNLDYRFISQEEHPDYTMFNVSL